jgi:hypothetical protein
MAKKFHVREREFLNLYTNLRAYIIACVEDSGPYPACCDQYRDGAEVELRLADCYNEIEMYFDLSSPAERANSLHKAKTLADVLARFHAAIETEIKAIEEREALRQHARAAAAIH